MNANNNMVALENRELNGITVKTAFWLIGGLCSILVAVLTTYASIISKLDKNQQAITEVRHSNELANVQIKTIEVQLQTVEIRLVRLEMQLKTNAKAE